MADLSHWDLAETFTGREAAYLLMGVDPSGPDADKFSARHLQERLETAYQGAIGRAAFEGYIEPCFSYDAPEPEHLMPEAAVLRSVALWANLERFREHGDTASFTGWLEYRDVSFHGQRFSRHELSRWLRENGLKSAYRFDLGSPAHASSHEGNGATPQAEKPLSNRERDTLLTIIAVLCKDAGYDFTKHAKTAGTIQSTAATMGVSIGETTIENHLKKIPDALAGRMK
ncbi:hypothetical protein [Hydrogenophaga defluvii]|uniref:Uncharacterized protein n=1 Tax=Hydrogenophaga defluvii TaxID=249410 RepID=A0ABW2SHS1_9BURK